MFEPADRPPPHPSVQQALEEMVWAAAGAYAHRQMELFELMVQQIIARPDVGGWRPAVERSLGAAARTGFTQAWAGGWQPADLIRLATRRMDRYGVWLLGSLMAEEMAGYAAATIDPRWAAQIQDLGATRWWPAGSTCLRAAREQADGGWSAVIPSAIEVVCLLRGLPRLERLMAIPGAFRAEPERAGDLPDVEEKVLARIRALLAKAEATTSEAEAEAFTAGAQERMARYSIDAAMLAATDPRRAQTPSGRRIGIDNPYEGAKAVLLDKVAKANRCRAVWSQPLGFCTVLGFSADLAAVEALFTSLLVQAVTSLTRAGSRTGPGGRSRTRAFRQSFLIAYATRIGERLEGITQEQTRAASTAQGGGNVLPVLASRNQAVEDAMAEMFGKLHSRSVGSVNDAEGWHSGRTAADLASLHGAQALT